MTKLSYSPDFDQNDPKHFRETLGSFGTTTMPGADQLKELQAKVRQGVKHVELHLNNSGKGAGGQLDTPDKYGFEERRTIMQLARLNKQSLSVHSSLDTVSFSGLGQQGFDESQRWSSIKEIDETLKFASETIKGGAVVLHLQGEGAAQGSRGELTLSKRYLKWLEDNGKTKELENLKKNYFKENPLDRIFVDNPTKRDELRTEYEILDKKKREEFENKNKNKIEQGQKPWEVYYMQKEKDKRKLAGNLSPYVVVGDQIQQVERNQEFIDLEILEGKNKLLNNSEIENLKKLGIRAGTQNISIDDFQKAMALFSNGQSKEIKEKLTQKEFFDLKKKLLITYDDVLKNNNFLQNQADSDFYKKFIDMNIGVMKLQKSNLNLKYDMFKDEIQRVEELEKENKDNLLKLNKIIGNSAEELAAKDAIKIHIAEKNKEIQHLKYNAIGQEDYHELSQYDKTIAEINKNLKELQDKSTNATSLAEDSFEKNTSALGYFGLKALKYQLDLKNKSKQSLTIMPELKNELNQLELKYKNAKTFQEKDKIAESISKKKYEIRKWAGVKDYNDINVKENPLYIAPENMLPGMGNFTSIEEYKAIIRMGQEDFAKKIFFGKEDSYKKIKEEYEKTTGEKIKTLDDAKKIAKKHIAGTFDSAHAASWLKHFRVKQGESEETRFEKFNQWLITEAESMAKEGIIKHIHFNNSIGKDDDHNLINTGILDMFELKNRLRKAGIKERLIVEAGGRGAGSNLHVLSAIDMFNPNLKYTPLSGPVPKSSSVSDWINVDRNYNQRTQFSSYGMNESTFRHIPPQQGQGREVGGWSGTSFF